MNGKAAKLLRKMKRADHKSKRKFKALPHNLKGKLRAQFKASGVVNTNLLPE